MRWRFIVIAVLLAVGLGTILGWRQGASAAEDGEAGSGPTAPAATATTTPHVTPTFPAVPAMVAGTDLSPTLEISEGGRTRRFKVALDQLALRLPSGETRVERIPPQAGLRALKDRARKMPKTTAHEVRPVVYELTEDGLATEPQFVSREIRAETTAVQALADSIPDVIEVRQLDYAPEYAVVEMSDSFAALEQVEAVRKLPSVKSADVLLAKQQSQKALPNDSLIAQQWHLKNTAMAGTDINVETVWNYPHTGYRGAGVIVGVVDDGLQTSHPDLAANVRTDIDYDWNDGTPNDPSPGAGDDHGTACAGNVAAVGNNSLGVAGSAPEASIVGLRLIADATTDAQEAEAMAYLKDVIHIKSNSWGPSDSGTVLEAPGVLTRAALNSAAETGRGGKGTIILWAGGNGLEADDNSNYDGYANSIYTIAVGALTNQQRQSYYSESGANLVVVAPSSGGTRDIVTTDRTGNAGYSSGDYANDFGGTSSSTPTAAGVVALMLQRNPNLGWRDVQEILIRTAVKVASTDADWVTTPAGFHFNHKFGAGLINATAAVNLAATWTNLAAPETAVSTQTSLSVAIPNQNTTGITRTFAVTSALRVEHVTVRVNINHSARGNLAITLTSPGGVASRLSEVHADAGNNYPDWTFSTVRHWGEASTGTWTLKIADLSNSGNSTGGTLTDAELTIHGVSGAPANPPPVVQLTSPADQTSYSVGAPVTLGATATDLTTEGDPGTVAQVEFLAGSSVVASLTASPYTTNWTPPAAGTYTLQARATDSEGAVGSSGSVTITVTNQPPVVTSAAITPGPQAFSDQALQLVGVSATDPEGAAVTLSYQWQSSADGLLFGNVSGQTSTSVGASAANAGKVWRCLITPSDGQVMGPVFTTEPTMVLTRPPMQVQRGTGYQYAADLVLRGNGDAFTRTAIINEFSQGPSGGTAEWVEILTLQSSSLVGWKFEDSPTASTRLTFANHPLWANVAPGTLIVIYNGSSKDPNLPANDADPADGVIVVASTDGALFSGSWPALGNSGDKLLIENASAAIVHQVSYGSAAGYPPNIGSVGSGTGAAFTGDTEAVAATADGWRVHSSTVDGSATVAGITPGQGNTSANISFVGNLRSGFYTQPALFRLGAGGELPTGLTLSAAGLLEGTVTGGAGDYPIVMEAYNQLGETVLFSYMLTVLPGPLTYVQWVSTFPTLSDSSGGADPEGDGRPNRWEYFQGFDPTLADGGAVATAEQDGTDLILRYRKAKDVTGVTETVHWSDDLAGWGVDGVVHDPDEDMGDHWMRTARKPMGTADRMFLRLTIQ